jgi:DNA-binding NarL/FixJ family response regulator
MKNIQTISLNRNESQREDAAVFNGRNQRVKNASGTDKMLNGNKQIRVMIVGDYLIFRSGLKLLLETEPSIKFVGEAANLSEATAAIRQIDPDVLIMNATEIDDHDGEFFTIAQNLETPVIVLTNSRHPDVQKKYLLLGAGGMVSKEQTAETLFTAIKVVNEGDVYFDRKLMSETIKQLVNEKKTLPEKIFAYNCAVLTDREREVLSLVCRGLKNKAVADKLFVTETTVRHHLTSIFEKLKVTSRLELVVYAFREQLVEIPSEQSDSDDDYR